MGKCSNFMVLEETKVTLDLICLPWKIFQSDVLDACVMSVPVGILIHLEMRECQRGGGCGEWF